MPLHGIFDDVARPAVGRGIPPMPSRVFIPGNPIQTIVPGSDHIQAAVVVDIGKPDLSSPFAFADQVFRPRWVLIPVEMMVLTTGACRNIGITVPIDISQCASRYRCIDVWRLDKNSGEWREWGSLHMRRRQRQPSRRRHQ